MVGAGSIGVSWAIVFARAGRLVSLFDPDPARLAAAPSELRAKVDELAGAGLLDADPDVVARRVEVVTDVGEAVRDAAYVQENAPERLELKRELLDRLGALTAEETVLASSTSAIMPSPLFSGLRGERRGLVVHPVNPPHLLPVVEVVPGQSTEPSVVERTEAFLEEVGMSPVRVHREVEGFVLNRLQGAVLREAYALVRDGVVDIEGVDRVVREGLGRRWAIMGPFETSDLNTRGGIAAHAERMGAAYARMGAERGQDDPWTPDLVARVAAQRRAALRLEDWEARVAWRDAKLVQQEAARRAAIRCGTPDPKHGRGDGGSGA